MLLVLVLVCYLLILRLARLRCASFFFEENNFRLREDMKGHTVQMRCKLIKGHDNPSVWVISYNRHHTNSLAEGRSPSLVVDVCVWSGINTRSSYCIVLLGKISPQSFQIYLHSIRHINVRPSRTYDTQQQNTVAVVVCNFLMLQHVCKPHNTKIPITPDHQLLVSIHHKMIL